MEPHWENRCVEISDEAGPGRPDLSSVTHIGFIVGPNAASTATGETSPHINLKIAGPLPLFSSAACRNLSHNSYPWDELGVREQGRKLTTSIVAVIYKEAGLWQTICIFKCQP